MLGRARCLPSAGEIQQTPTREPTETLSKTNSLREEGSGQECVDGRGRQERREGTCQGWAVAGLAALIKGQAGLPRAAR